MTMPKMESKHVDIDPNELNIAIVRSEKQSKHIGYTGWSTKDKICGVITYKGKCDYSLIINPSVFSVTDNELIFYEVDKCVEPCISWLLAERLIRVDL